MPRHQSASHKNVSRVNEDVARRQLREEVVSVVGIADQAESDAPSAASASSDVAGMLRMKHATRVQGDVRPRQVSSLLLLLLLPSGELSDGRHLTVQVAVAPLQLVAQPEETVVPVQQMVYGIHLPTATTITNDDLQSINLYCT